MVRLGFSLICFGLADFLVRKWGGKYRRRNNSSGRGLVGENGWGKYLAVKRTAVKNSTGKNARGKDLRGKVLSTDTCVNNLCQLKLRFCHDKDIKTFSKAYMFHEVFS